MHKKYKKTFLVFVTKKTAKSKKNINLYAAPIQTILLLDVEVNEIKLFTI